MDGPLGSRVFALAVSPKDGGVWGATEAGLFRYAHSRWTYFTRAEGLPSDQAQALAFASDGTLYVGTQCDGIAVGSPDDNYKTWRVTPGPAALPNTAAGRGLPSALINCLLVTSDNTVFAGTTTGLAKSRDGGETWTFVRGLDWKAKLAGLYHPIAPAPSTYTGDLLTEDYVTALAEDERGRLFVGHRQTGVEAFEAKTGKRLQSGASGAKTDAYAFCLLTAGRSAWVGQYGGGLLPPADIKADAAPASSSKVVDLPVPAAPPPLAELNAMTAKVKSQKGEMLVGGGAYLGEDWQTQGDAIGHYGRQYARFFAMQAPWGDHFPVSVTGYQAVAEIGPQAAGHDALRSYVQWVKTDNPRSLYDPMIGYRRQAEADDHGEDVNPAQEGPDIWIRVSVPAGFHRVSLYLFNKDGHDGENRYRDYLISLLPYRVQTAEAQTLAPLAQARVRDFWGGSYKLFLVHGPNPYYLRIARNNSHNTLCSAVFIDKLSPVSKAEDMATLWLGAKRYDLPVPPTPESATASGNAACTLWTALDAAPSAQQALPRLLAYRGAVASNASPLLVANWRWRLNLWQESDRTQFSTAMAAARASLLELEPNLRTVHY